MTAERCTDPTCVEHWPRQESMRLNGEGMWEFAIPMPPLPATTEGRPMPDIGWREPKENDQ